MDPGTFDGSSSTSPSTSTSSRIHARNGSRSLAEEHVPSSPPIPVNGDNGATFRPGNDAASRKPSFSFQNDSPLSRAGLLHPKVHHSVEDANTSPVTETSPVRAHSESPATDSPRPLLAFMRRTSNATTGSLPRSFGGRLEAGDHHTSTSPTTRIQPRSQGDIRLSTMQLSEIMLSPQSHQFFGSASVPRDDGSYFGVADHLYHPSELKIAVDAGMQDRAAASKSSSSQDPASEHHDANTARHVVVQGDVNSRSNSPFRNLAKDDGNIDTPSLPYKSGLSLLLKDKNSPRSSPDGTPTMQHQPVIIRTGSTGSVLTITPSHLSAEDQEALSGSPTPVPTRLHSPTSESPHTTMGLPPLALPSVSSSSSKQRPAQARQRSIKWHPSLDAHPSHAPHHMSPPPDIEASPLSILSPIRETQPLLLSSSKSSTASYGAAPMSSPTPVATPDLRKLSPKYILSKVMQKLGQNLGLVRKVDREDVKHFVYQGFSALPAVLLGCLLNILDGVSYGMLIFPTSEPFNDMGPTGVSLFFISAVVSQFVYTLGGSGFAGANGSMMIEVVPFFHILAQTIASEIGVENAREVIATTLVAYALSSLLTGLAFLLLGALRLGVVIGFFPRHILVGCIGGVGVFLLQTGLTVSLRIPDDDFAYNWDLVKILFFNTKNLLLWGVPAGLAVLLRLVTMRWKGQLVFPIYFVIIPVVFYVVVAAARLDLNVLRREGWIFDVGGGDEPWWQVYEYFDMKLIHWGPLWDTLPTQLFFNILHPPLNVPALSVSLDEDINTNKELVGHGYSNLLSGIVGSVPNYLVYVNTLLFYRVGGSTRVAGFLLGLANILLLWIGTGPIRYLPVCVVGALIFVLGWDLVKEAIWDTRGRVSRMEFITIVSIMVAMTVWDFVIGVLFGIVVSCFFFVVQNSQRRSIRSIHTGETAMSTVRRPSSQRAYIKEVSKQTTILRMQGFLFFGTITYVEEAIRNVVEGHLYSNPVRFLVLDMTFVAGLDMSSAEAFVRVHRMLRDKGITMVFCGFKGESEIGRALSNVDVLGAEGVELFETFGDAIEWTENCYLRAWYRSQKELVLPYALPGRQDADTTLSPSSVSSTSVAGSPRRSHLNDVGFRTIANDIPPPSTAGDHPEPYNTLIKVFSSFGEFNSDHLLALVPYLRRISLPEGHVLWKQGDVSDGLYIVESGVLRASYQFSTHSASVEESMVSGTLAGELSTLSGLERNATVWVERDAVVWKLGTEELKRLEHENPTLEKMVLRMVVKSAKVDYDILLSALASRQ
ncbi:hypothetical protein V5O48_008082 [Marasmius crinis-equi]|uniref:Sulfate transporter n=1 Tax=Marasmius crinis-equi TaxID=585013 RepID=A0ABR3FF23_9AGAR